MSRRQEFSKVHVSETEFTEWGNFQNEYKSRNFSKKQMALVEY